MSLDSLPIDKDVQEQRMFHRKIGRQGGQVAEAMKPRRMPKKCHHDAKPCLLVYRSLDTKQGRVKERSHQMTAKTRS